MFLISICRGDWNLGLRPTSVLAFREPRAMAKSDFSCVKTRFFPGFCHCAGILQRQVPKLCAELDLGLLYILILGTYRQFARKNNFLSLGVCFPQLCSSAGRRFAASRSRAQNYWRNVFTTKISMKYVVNWIPLRIRVRSNNTQPHLKLGHLVWYYQHYQQ